jgi:methionyl-tRNA formyltransferase
MSGELRATPQDAAAATMAPMLKKDDGRIDWSHPAQRVHDHARGMTPWPGAWTTLGGKLFKVLATRVAHGPAGGAPGEVVVAHKGRIEVACGEGRVEIVRAQVEGKKALGATDLVAGRTLAVGTRLGHDPA